MTILSKEEIEKIWLNSSDTFYYGENSLRSWIDILIESHQELQEKFDEYKRSNLTIDVLQTCKHESGEDCLGNCKICGMEMYMKDL